MRQLAKVVTAVLVLFPGAGRAPAQQAEGWVGQRVIIKVGTVLTVGRRVVDDPYRQASAHGGDRSLVPVYRVEQVKGSWLWLVPEQTGISGWVKAVQAVPYDRAIDYFTGAIRAHPTDPTPYVYRGNAWLEIGDLHKAIADYTEAIRLDPHDTRAPDALHLAWEGLLNRGVSLLMMGEVDKAIADFTEAIRLNPGDLSAHGNRGNAWRRKGEFDKAIADYSEVIRLDPNNTLAYAARAGTWESKREYEKALADVTAATRLNAREALGYENRGAAGKAKAVREKALAELTAASRLTP